MYPSPQKMLKIRRKLLSNPILSIQWGCENRMLCMHILFWVASKLSHEEKNMYSQNTTWLYKKTIYIITVMKKKFTSVQFLLTTCGQSMKDLNIGYRFECKYYQSWKILKYNWQVLGNGKENEIKQWKGALTVWSSKQKTEDILQLMKLTIEV